MQDRMMEEIAEDFAHIEEKLAERKLRRPPDPAGDELRRRTAGNKRYTPPRRIR